MICPHCNKVIDRKEQWEINREKRKDLILKKIKETHREVITATTLYRECRKAGYTMKWKTFYRDLIILKSEGKIKAEARPLKMTRGLVIIK